MLRSYEEKHNLAFRYIVRIRPDIIILSTWPRVFDMEIQPGEAVVPMGITMGVAPVNDHMFFCEGQSAVCSAYFNVVDAYVDCHGRPYFGHGDGSDLLYMTLVKNNVTPKKIVFPYTIFRPCKNAADCYRLKSLPDRWTLMRKCEAKSKEICAKH